jgi:hypothetical protein
VRSVEREPAIAAVRQAVEAVSSQRERQAVSYAVDVDPQ